MSDSLLREEWSGVDSAELMILLKERIGGSGQVDREVKPEKFYLPLAGPTNRVAITYKKGLVVRIEAGPAFDTAEWERISTEIEISLLGGSSKRGRDFSFSSRRVLGSWEGKNSGVQILPPPETAPRANVESADHPFILEFPLRVSELWPITNHRRLREHRKLTLVLNVLLSGHISYFLQRSEHLWAKHHLRENVDWVQRFFWADLGEAVSEKPTTLPTERITEIDPDQYYNYERPGGGGAELRVPTNLDESLVLYQVLNNQQREKFDRAAYWLDMASRQWWLSASSSFACLVSAIESLVENGSTHQTFCDQCQKNRYHETPGAGQRFKTFLETYAADGPLQHNRDEMYRMRSLILHGARLLSFDEVLSFGWEPPEWNERQIHTELWTLTQIALRNWLRRSPG
jgi:hypothetical protein